MLLGVDCGGLVKTARQEKQFHNCQLCSQLTCIALGLVTSCMHKNQPGHKSNQALLARVKKEMDEPRMAEATREDYDVNHTTLQELKKLSGN
jgi:hypothetical protein